MYGGDRVDCFSARCQKLPRLFTASINRVKVDTSSANKLSSHGRISRSSMHASFALAAFGRFVDVANLQISNIVKATDERQTQLAVDREHGPRTG